MGTVDDLLPLLKKLRLSGVLDTLEARVREAVEDELSHSEFLLRLLRDEVERREAKQLTTRIRKANFEHAKSLETFDFRFNPTVPKAKVLELATCTFIERHDNVVLMSPTGVGKSHLAQALGNRACRAGHTVQYIAAHQLFAELRAARADNSLERRMHRYVSVDLLILDDLGLRPLQSTDPLDLYDLIRGRYERGSMVVTTNQTGHSSSRVTCREGRAAYCRRGCASPADRLAQRAQSCLIPLRRSTMLIHPTSGSAPPRLQIAS